MDYQELRSIYRETDKALALFNQKITGFIPTSENVENAWKELDELKKRVSELPVNDDKVAALIKHHFNDFTDSLEYTLEDAESHPENNLLRFNWSIDFVSRLNRDPDDEKCKGLMNFLKNASENKEVITDLIIKRNDKDALNALSRTFRYDSDKLKEQMGKLTEKFPKCSEGLMNEFKDLLQKHINMLDELTEKFTDKEAKTAKTSEDLNRTVFFGKKEYETLLRKKLGVSLDELLEWNQEELKKTRDEVFEIASKLDIPEPAPKTMQEVTDVLFRYEGPCSSGEEMIARANEYLKRTRALAHEYVDLPDDEYCTCVTIPDSCKDSYPWGGYEGGDFSVRPFRGQMFLNQHNYKNINDGWIKLNALHETYPGHHVQYVKAALSETPETVKIGAKLVPVLEGTCLRTEKAFEFIYGEDPFFPLFTAYRRHHTAVRICVDLLMFYYGGTLEEAVELYEKEMGFDRGTAIGQVRSHENQPGYFTCYYYGRKKLCGWEEEYGFSKKDFTELIFDAGYISIDTMGEYLRLSPEDRERYYHDFCSLLKEEIKVVE